MLKDDLLDPYAVSSMNNTNTLSFIFKQWSFTHALSPVCEVLFIIGNRNESSSLMSQLFLESRLISCILKETGLSFTV